MFTILTDFVSAVTVLEVIITFTNRNHLSSEGLIHLIRLIPKTNFISLKRYTCIHRDI